MPQMANITVKNGQNVDVVFKSLTPSSGDTTQAQWRVESGLAPVFSPALSVKTTYNGPKTGRRVTLSAAFPTVDTVGGVSTVTATEPFKLELLVPLNVLGSVPSDNAVVFANLLKSTLLQEILATGYNAS